MLRAAKNKMYKSYFAVSVKSLRCLRALWLGLASVPFCMERNSKMTKDVQKYPGFCAGNRSQTAYL